MMGILINKIKEKKKIIIATSIFLILFVAILFTIRKALVPTLKLNLSENEIAVSNKEEIVIPAVLSKLPDNLYPAASVSIKFDNNKLEFVDLATGTMESYNDYDKEKDEKPSFKVPNWSYNTKLANEEGEIKAMYLDTTVGKNAYNTEGFKKGEKDMPFKLIFKLKNSVNPNDTIKIDINEAVFATPTGETDKTTLSTKKGYGALSVKGVEIKIK